MVAQQTTEFAPGPLFGNQLKAAVAGVAVGAGDVGLLHPANMRLRLNRSSPAPLPPPRQRSGATQQGSAGGALGQVIEFKGREPQQNQRSNRQRGYAHACGEVLSGSGNGHKPYLLRRKLEGGKHLAARSDQTAAEREREVGSARSTTLRVGTG
jgi:hypothetical protein